MFRQVYQSEPFQYLTKEFIKDPFAPFVDTDPIYNLNTNPTQYSEELDWVTNLFTERKKNPYSDVTVHVFTRNRLTFFPGAGFRDYEFDSTQGKYLNDPMSNTPILRFLTVMIRDLNIEADGSPWVTFLTNLKWAAFNLDTMKWDTSMQVDPALYGVTDLGEFFIDRQNNILVKNQGAGPTCPWLDVHNFTTGEVIRSICISGVPKQIFPEDKDHCYVFCTNGMLNLVNYTTGKVISAFRAPISTDDEPVFFDVGFWVFGYDRFYKRLLGIEKLPNDPVTGQNTSYVRGWYPVPLPVRIMKPIPLIPPRANRNVPYLTRLFGDAGEPVGGVNFQASATGVTTILTSPGITNENGEAIIQAKSTTNGSATLTLTAKVITS